MDAHLLSIVFQEWNKLKHSPLDEQRSNRALSIILKNGEAQQKFHQYGTTYWACHCPDYVERGAFCKHRRAFIILWRVYQRVKLEWIGEYKVERRLS